MLNAGAASAAKKSGCDQAILMVNEAHCAKSNRRLKLFGASLLAGLSLMVVLVFVLRAECASVAYDSAAKDTQSLDPKQDIRKEELRAELEKIPVRALHPGFQGDQNPPPGMMERYRRQVDVGQLQQLELEEQNIKRQLPELIAQAHQDKQTERALLRMLISASLKSGLSGNVASVGSRPPAERDGESVLLDGEPRPARLEQGILEGVDLNALIDAINQINAGPMQPLDQQYAAVDKREYIKPCSFNAISCVRTPFRKL